MTKETPIQDAQRISYIVTMSWQCSSPAPTVVHIESASRFSERVNMHLVITETVLLPGRMHASGQSGLSKVRLLEEGLVQSVYRYYE